MSVANLADPMFAIFIAIKRRDMKLFKDFKLSFVVIVVPELVHFENHTKLW